MVDYTIRRMNKGDIKQLSELEKVCFSVPWSEQSFAEEFENDLAVYFIAEQCGNLIGYIGFWRIIDEGHITNIAVSPDFRRNGIATALIGTAVKYAKTLNLVLLTLEVRKSNLAAQHLYRNFGFVALGERKDYYTNPRENAVIMTLTLGEQNEYIDTGD